MEHLSQQQKENTLNPEVHESHRFQVQDLVFLELECGEGFRSTIYLSRLFADNWNHFISLKPGLSHSKTMASVTGSSSHSDADRLTGFGSKGSAEPAVMASHLNLSWGTLAPLTPSEMELEAGHVRFLTVKMIPTYTKALNTRSD